MASVDLNSDLGEGFGAWRLGDDAALLNVVTSANVACGFHAGDPATIRRTDLLNGYRYPRWLLVVGWLAWLLTLYLAANSIRPVIELFS